MKLSFLFVIAILPFSYGKSYFRKDYSYDHGAEGWVKLNTMPATFEEARLRCFFEGSVLASPLNENLWTAMRKKMDINVYNVLTGLSANFSSGDFYSVEGVSLNTIPHFWTPGQPNNYDGENQCISMSHSGALSVVNCLKSLPYVCFKKYIQNETVTKCGTTDPEYVLYDATGHCYKFHKFGQTWSKAFMACSAEGGYLAIINSDKEAALLRDIMYDNPAKTVVAKLKDYIGIGVRDWSDHGVFMTIHGQTPKKAGYDFWGYYQPDNSGGNENCGTIYRDAKLYDTSCEDTVPFICEMVPWSLNYNTMKRF